MASAMPFSKEELTCRVCRDIYKDPVILTCGHDVCRDCLPKFWQENNSKECPVCRNHCEKDEFPQNLHLKKFCEIFLGERRSRDSVRSQAVLCSEHNQKLKLFCHDDERPICIDCRHSKNHEGHKFSPIEEAVDDCKVNVDEKIKPLEEKLEKFERVKCNLDKTAQYIKVQAQQAERQIKQEFEKLYQFLRDEEAARIAALRKEEEQKSQMMKDKIEKIDADIKTLLHTIRSIKEDVGKDDIIFLKNFRGTIKRAKSKLQVPDRSEGTLINMAKHLGNLNFRVWRKVKDNVQYTPVTLDPNTAHSQLLLSEDLTSVAYIGEPQDVPDNPERFDKLPNVLGSVGFDTGTPSWEVEIRDVKDGQFWGLGVRAESDQRKGRFSAKSGVWSVSCANGKYSAVSPSQKHTLLKVEEVQRIKVQQVQRIKVQLDYEKGKLSFSDADNSTLIHTFTDTFTERVFPFFYGKASFSILPRAFVFKYNKVHKKRDLTI